MKTRNLLAIGGIIVMASACVPSINPYYTEKEVVFDARLAGEWQTKDDTSDKETWKFEKSGENGYTVLVTDKDQKQGTLDARLFKLGDQRFLDLIPKDCKFAPNQADLVGMAMFPGHLILRVPQIEPTLQLGGCDFDWLSKYLESHPEALSHHKEQDRLVLTASTRDLQAFITQHLAELFPKSQEYARVPAQ
jgi:hypothetical protein